MKIHETEYKGLKYTAEDFSKMTRSEAEYRRQLMAMSKEEVSLKIDVLVHNWKQLMAMSEEEVRHVFTNKIMPQPTKARAFDFEKSRAGDEYCSI